MTLRRYFEIGFLLILNDFIAVVVKIRALNLRKAGKELTVLNYTVNTLAQ